MKISVILPCFNGAATIAVQLEALTRQSWKDGWEVVVVNNGSTDRSMEIVTAYAERLPALRIVEAHDPSGPRLGVTHSYSVGFAAAAGDAFILCESDDEVGDGWLTLLGEALEQHEFVAAALEYERLNAPDVVPSGHNQQTAESGLSNASPPLYLPFASGCSLGFRRSVYEALGDPDPGCAATWDLDYCWRANLAGIPLEFVPAAKVHYRLRTTLKGAYSQGKNWALANVACHQKYRPLNSGRQVLKNQARGAFDFAKHLVKSSYVPLGKSTPNEWAWGLGWCTGIMRGELGRWMSIAGQSLMQTQIRAARFVPPLQIQPPHLVWKGEEVTPDNAPAVAFEPPEYEKRAS